VSAPEFLCSSYRYFTRASVSDVQTIIDDFKSETVSHGGWTEVSAGLYKSPPDDFNRWFDILLSKITAQKLECRVRDPNGVTICTRRINLPSTTTWSVFIYTGQFHAIIDVDPGASAFETLQAGILDLSPEAQNAHTHYVYGTGSRSTADSVDNNGAYTCLYLIDNVTPVVTNRVSLFMGAGSTNVGVRTLNGSRVYRMREVWGYPVGTSSGNQKFAGRCYQQILLDGFVTVGAEFLVPIDTGLSAKFKVTGISAQSGYTTYWRTAVRIA
jgi:hypothetical protein